MFHWNLESNNLDLSSRNIDIDGTCTFKNNPHCHISNNLSYNPTCCTPESPCGIAQGGCQFDDDCFDNLECSDDNCGLNNNGTKCCQAPGRKPSKQEYYNDNMFQNLLSEPRINKNEILSYL